MRFYAIGNGQLHQMSMKDVANTLDTMHDAQIVMKTVINSSGGVFRRRWMPPITKVLDHETERSVKSWPSAANRANASMSFAA